jgi:hypothetical protein
MSVNFGKATTAWFGNTSLTKAINRGGFGLSTSLDLSKVQDAADRTCKEYPVKQARLVRTPMRPMIMESKGREVISYGLAGPDKSGRERVFGPSWQLALGGPTDGYQFTIILVYAQLHSGKIDEVKELEYFLNELERNLRDLDPQAMINLVESDE